MPRRIAGQVRRVSMADVAARAGVSGQTVSRVVNGSPRVDPATRARVEAAMAELGYRPHRAARALRTGRTHTIGLVVSTLATVGNSRMLQAVSDAAASRGLALVVVTLHAEVDGGIASAFERLEDQGVDGVVVLNEATLLARDGAPPEGLRLGRGVPHIPPPPRRGTVGRAPGRRVPGAPVPRRPTMPAARGRRHGTSSRSVIRASVTSPVRWAATRRPSASAVGARRSRMRGSRSRSRCAVRGRRAPATPPRHCLTTPRRRCSARTTRWRSGCSGASPSGGSTFPRT